MPLTKAWYAKLKNDNKVEKKAAPETPWEVALETFEELKTKLDKAATSQLCDSAIEALKTLKHSASSSGDALEKAGFVAVAKEVYSSVGAIKKEKTAVEKIQTDLGLARIRELSANDEEATYETLWHVFEGQRDKVNAEPSLVLFKSCKASLDKLKAQADVCGQSSAHLLGKYNKQTKVLVSIQNLLDTKKDAYKAALVKAVKDRQDLLGDMVTLTTTQTATLAKLQLFHTGATAAVTTKNGFALAKLKKESKTTADAAGDRHRTFTVTFAPGTTIRDSQDLKDAKIHADESVTAVMPLSNKIFSENKGLLVLDKQIKQVASDIEALKISAK
ncbi:MAG: hypothetical protein ACRC2B_15095 [Rubrivivax sp.]